MGKYIKISLALFYFLQLLIGFRESVVLLFEGASELAKHDTDDTEHAAIKDEEPSPDSAARRSLFFLKQAFDFQRHSTDKLTSNLAAALLLHHELHHHFDTDRGEEHATAAQHHKRRRLALQCIRNLFSEIAAKAIPPGCERSHHSRQTPRLLMSAT